MESVVAFGPMGPAVMIIPFLYALMLVTALVIAWRVMRALERIAEALMLSARGGPDKRDITT